MGSEDTPDVDGVVGVIEMRHWDVYRVQHWLWELYQETRHNLNLSSTDWDTILGLFEGHRIDGHALLELTDSDLTRMGIVAIGVQKVILSAVPKEVQLVQKEMNDEDLLFVETPDSFEAIVPEMSSPQSTLSNDNLYECLLDYHKRFPSTDGFIHQSDVLQHYDMSSEHQWFVQHILDYYHDKFHIKYDESRQPMKQRSIKLALRNASDICSVNDQELKSILRGIISDYPIGIDIISLLQEYEERNEGRMFDRCDGMTLIDRLKTLQFVVTSCRSGY